MRVGLCWQRAFNEQYLDQKVTPSNNRNLINPNNPVLLLLTNPKFAKWSLKAYGARCKATTTA